MAENIIANIDVAINTGQASAELKKLQQQINAFNLTLSSAQMTQGQATKQWSSELAGAVNQSRFFRAETVRMQTAAGALDSTLRRGSATLGQFFSAKFNRSGAMAAEVTALASERVRTLQTQFVATSKAANGMQEGLAIRPLAAFSSQSSIATERMRVMNNMFRQGTTQLLNFGKNVQWAGRQLMVGFTVPLTIFGATASRIFRDIEKEAVNFRKVYGDIFTTDLELEKNLDQVKDLAREFTKYGIAAKDTLQLAAIGAQAGKEGAELQAATVQATRLSILGDLDRQASMRTTIALQSAFKLSNDELENSINFLNMVENSSVLSLQDLAEAIPRVAPVITGLGGTVEEMAVFLAAMREGGVNAAEAANGLKSSLGRLISPTRQAKDMASSFGIELEDIVKNNEGNLLGMIINLSTEMQKLADLEKQQLLSAVFGKFQFARMGALFENIGREGSQATRIIEMMDMSIEDMASTADKELSAIEESVGTQFTAAMERLKLAIEPIGELFTKMAIPIINLIAKIAEWFSSLSDSRKELVGWGLAIVGILVPTVTMMTGLLMNLLAQISKVGQAIAIFFGAFIRGGPIAAVKAVTQQTKYLSLAEIDAANAAQQLGLATQFANDALRHQAAEANNSRVAIDHLVTSYTRLIAAQAGSAKIQPQAFETGKFGAQIARQSATQISRTRGIKFARRNKGGEIFSLNQGNMVPGVGNTDTVPAMLTPGEFVVNKNATSKNIELLSAINGGMNLGGMVKNGIAHANIGMLVTRLLGSLFSKGKFAKSITAQTSRLPKSTIDISKPMTNEPFISKTSRATTTRTQSAAVGKGQIDVQDGSLAQRSMGDGPVEYLRNFVLQLKAQTNQYMRGGGASRTFRGKDGTYGSTPSEFLKDITNPVVSYGGKSASYNPFIAVESFARKLGTPFGSSQKAQATDAITKRIQSLVLEGRQAGKVVRIVDDNALELAKFTQDPKIKYVTTSELFDDSIMKVFGPDLTKVLQRFGAYRVPSSIANRAGGGSQTRNLTRQQQEELGFEDFISGYQGKATQQNKEIAEILGISPREVGTLVQLSHMTGSKFGKALPSLRLNKGNIVPGVGNADTVPAMLTPGEFVVNKNATKENYDLLTAINGGMNAGGKVKGYNAGAKVKGYNVGGIVGSMALSSGAFFAADKLGGGNMMLSSVASMAALFLAQPLTKIITPQINKLAAALGIGTKAFLGISAPIVLLGTALVLMHKTAKKFTDSGAELVRSMYGTSKDIEAMAQVFGRETFSEKRSRQAVEMASGVNVGQEAMQFASQYTESDAGKDLFKRIEGLSKSSNAKTAAEALGTTLMKGILSGAITTEEASAIAQDMSKKLGDRQIAIDVGARIRKLIGPNGENISDNILQLQAEITPNINFSKVLREAEKDFANASVWQKLSMKVMGKGPADMAMSTFAQSVVSGAESQGVVLDALKEEFASGAIGYEEFSEKRDALILDSLSLSDKATEEIYKKFDEGSKEAIKAIKAVKDALDELADEKLDDLDDDARENIEQVKNEILDKNLQAANIIAKALEGADPKEQLEILKGFGLSDKEASITRDKFQVFGAQGISTGLEKMEEVDPQRYQEMIGSLLNGAELISEQVRDRFVTGFKNLEGPVQEILAKTFQENPEFQNNVMKAFEQNPKILSGLQDFAMMGGDIYRIMGKDLQELIGISDNADKLLRVPDAFKEAFGTDKLANLMANEEAFERFVKQAELGEKVLKEIDETENLDKDVALNILGNYLGDESLIKGLLEYFIGERGMDLEEFDLKAMVTMGLTNPEFIAAMRMIANGEVSPWAEKTVLEGSNFNRRSQDRDDNNKETGKKELSTFEKIKQSVKETLEYRKAIASLAKQGVSSENISLLDQAQMLDLTNKQRVQAIKLLKEQQEVQKRIEIFSKSAAEIEELRLNNQIKVVDRNLVIQNRIIQDAERLNRVEQDRIDNLSRQTELDQRQISVRNRALELLSRRENVINEAYDARFEALDRVANANQRIAQQQRDQISLASALTSGDIAAAAQAAATMSENSAAQSIQDARTSLENSRERELSELTEVVNGQRLTRVEIERQIQEISDRIYERDLQIIDLEDVIYNRTQALKPVYDEINRLNDQRIQLTRDLEDAQYQAFESELSNVNRLIEAYNQLFKAKKDGNGKKVGGGKQGAKKGKKKAFGGEMQRLMYGGLASYKGSSEPPPRPVRMAFGSTVPGLGNVDRVPALLTPGEFVIRKSVAERNMPLLEALNSQIFPNMSSFEGTGATQFAPIDNSSVTNMPVYNTYSVNVNVPNTNASPDEIANAVMSRIKRVSNAQVRTTRR